MAMGALRVQLYLSSIPERQLAARTEHHNGRVGDDGASYEYDVGQACVSVCDT